MRANLPHYLPYALLIIAVYLTSELLLNSRVRQLVHRVYLIFPTRFRMWGYLIVFLIGGGLLCLYWKAAGKAATVLTEKPAIPSFEAADRKSAEVPSVASPTAPPIAVASPSPLASPVPAKQQRKSRHRDNTEDILLGRKKWPK